jgi:hypothetical protein
MTTQTTLWEGGQGALALRSQRSRISAPLFRPSGRIVVLPALLALRHEGRNEGSPRAEEAKGFSRVLVLIANARLESRPTVRKQSVRLESNRKRIVVSSTCHSFTLLALRYEGRYEERRPAANVGSLACPPWRATNHSSLITAVPWQPWPARRGGRLIYGAAIRNPRKPLEIQLDDYLKSTVKGVLASSEIVFRVAKIDAQRSRDCTARFSPIFESLMSEVSTKTKDKRDLLAAAETVLSGKQFVSSQEDNGN